MDRLTNQDGICMNCDGIAYCRMDCFYKKIYDKLKYYEDLEEQNRLEILCTEEEEVKYLYKKCLNCKWCTGFKYGKNPCDMQACPVYVRLKKLRQTH